MGRPSAPPVAGRTPISATAHARLRLNPMATPNPAPVRRGSPAIALRKALVSTSVAFVVLCGIAYGESPEVFSIWEVLRSHSVLLGSILLGIFGLDLLLQARGKQPDG